jgi:perosamine synthetase
MSQVNDHLIKIPQVSPWLDQEEIDAATHVIKSNWLTEGAYATQFSARLNELIGTPYGVFAPNGTLALYLGLLALNLGPGDEVIVPDITFNASANAVIMAGATPVFVEVNESNYQLDITKCGSLITKQTRAIMPVHLYGMTANMTAIMDFAQQHKLLVIEDAAQAIGVRYKGQHAGTFGEVGCFSFFADKTITTGEGGYVVCREKPVYERLLLLRNQGRLARGSFIHQAIGYNFRITDIQAAIGLAQLSKLKVIIERKQTIMKWYQRELTSVPEVHFLSIEPGSDFVPFRMVLLCKKAHHLITYLSERGVQGRTFFYPLHQQPCFAYLDRMNGGILDLRDAVYPNAIFGYEHGILLPIFPTLSEEQVCCICAIIRDFYFVRP